MVRELRIHYAWAVFLVQAASASDFTPARPMLTPRVLHTATLLPDGKLLVAGGVVTNRPIALTANAELYDPATGKWTPTGPMTTARKGHTATLLPSGKVLVAGGSTNKGCLSDAELYDPVTGTWTVTGSLTNARAFHTATLLPSGKVLVAGGNTDDRESQGRVVSGRSYHALGRKSARHEPEGSAELYDPAKGTWTPISLMKTTHAAHTATLLADGRVLVGGGSLMGEGAGSAELYTPSNGTWTAAGPFHRVCGMFTATPLPGGKVLAVGGGHGRPSLASVELFDPATELWAPLVNELNTARHSHTATLLPNGKLLVVGGVGTVNGFAAGLASAELFDPATGAWTETSGLNTVRYMHTATLLTNGSVLLAGGWGTNGVLASTEMYVSAVAPAGTNTSPPARLYGHIPTLLPVPKPPPVVPQSAGSKLLSNASFGVSLLAYSLRDKLEEMRASATEPGYGAHPLSDWVRDVQFESSAMPQPLRPEAETAIAHIGTNAIPFLLKWMGGGSSSTVISDGTLQAFRVLGPRARSAIPELARLATNQPESVLRGEQHLKRGFTAFGYGPLYALGAIGPEAMPAVLTILTNAIAPGTKHGAIGALAAMGTNARPAVPVLLRYTDDENDMVASAVVSALGVVGADDATALAALEHIARCPDVSLRGTALLALSRFGDQGVPALLHGLGDTNKGPAYIAFHMLAWNMPKAITNSNVLAIAAARLQSQDADWREWAAYVLRAAGQQASGVKPDFMIPISREHLRFEDATNLLRRLAPELLGDHPPRQPE